MITHWIVNKSSLVSSRDKSNRIISETISLCFLRYRKRVRFGTVSIFFPHEALNDIRTLPKLSRKLDDYFFVDVENHRSSPSEARTRRRLKTKAEFRTRRLLEKSSFSGCYGCASPVKWIIGDMGTHHDKWTAAYDGSLLGEKWGRYFFALYSFLFFLSSPSFDAPPFRREDLHTFRESLTLLY